MVVPPFKVDLHPMFAANFLQTLTQPFKVWDYHVWILVVVPARVCCVASVINFWLDFCLDLNSIESPCRAFAFCECSI